MTFSIYLPTETIKEQRGEAYPILYCLAGLSSNHENFTIKSHFGVWASKHRIACVFPDTSPRGDLGIEGLKDDWGFGDSAGYYLNATQAPYNKHFNMYSYVIEELPTLLGQHFHVDTQK